MDTDLYYRGQLQYPVIAMLLGAASVTRFGGISQASKAVSALQRQLVNGGGTLSTETATLSQPVARDIPRVGTLKKDAECDEQHS